MENMFNNLMTQAQAYGPKLITALVILAVAYVVGKIVQWALAAGIKKAGFDGAGPKDASLGKSLGSAAFWVILLFGVIQALTKMEMHQVADPLNNMVEQIMFYLPKIFGAAIVFSIFMLVAKVVKNTAQSVLVFADPVPEKLGLTSGPANVSGISATVLSALTIIIGGITALGVLNIPAITEPTSAILTDVMAAVPNIFLAVIILGLFLMIAKFVSGLIRNTLPSTGIDKAISELGVLKGADKGLTATSIIAKLSTFFIVLMGLIQALKALKFDMLTDAMNVVLDMGASIAFGAFIIFAGVFLARIVSNAMSSAGGKATDTAAGIVKWIIIGLTMIMGISRMGLDPTGGTFVLDVAKLLAMGAAVGVAGAIAIGFGWGGRDWFGKQLESWRPNKK